MRVTVTGATGLVGRRLVAALEERGDEVTVLSRNPEKARSRLGVEAAAWNPADEPAPAAALAGRDGIIHLAGEPVAQRWNDDVKRRILDSRVQTTRKLVEAIGSATRKPATLVSASAVGYYGDRGEEILTERSAPGSGFLPEVSVQWEREAGTAERSGVRTAMIRIGIVLGPNGGALQQMLPPFRLGLGGKLGS